MPKRKHKSRLRKKDFTVYAGEQNSSVLKSKRSRQNPEGEALLHRTAQTAKRALGAVGSVLALPFTGLASLVRRRKGKGDKQEPLPYYRPSISAHAPELKTKEKQPLPIVGAAGVVLDKHETPKEPKRLKRPRLQSRRPAPAAAEADKPSRETAQRRPKATHRPKQERPAKELRQPKEKAPREKVPRASGRWGKRLGIAAAALLVCAGLGWGGWYYFEGRYVYLSVDDDGAVTQIRSAMPTVEQMLAEAGITLGADDEMDTPMETALADDMAIHIIRAKTITIDTGDGNQVQTLLAKGTVQQALDKAGVTLGAEDEIDTALDTDITGDMAVNITRAKQISIQAKAGNKTVLLASGTVKDALDKSGLAYDTEDEITPALDSRIKDGMTIKLVRLTIKHVTHTEKIAFETIEKKSNRVERGDTEVSQKGVNGVRTIKEKVVYKDGAEVKRVEESNEVTKQAVNKIVLIGTGPPMNPAVKGLPETPTSKMIIRKVTVDQITAYTHTGRRTATGKWPKVGMCAVNPRVFGYGTMFYVPGYGYAVAEDTGANNSSEVSIDLFMDTKEDCLRWGRKRNVTVTIVRRP